MPPVWLAAMDRAVGPSQQNQACCPVPAGKFGIPRRSPGVVSQKAHTVLVAVTLGVLHRVVEEKRHAAEWCTSRARSSFRPSPFESAVDKSADDRVQSLDPFDGRFGQLSGRNLTRADQLGLSHRILPTKSVPS